MQLICQNSVRTARLLVAGTLALVRALAKAVDLLVSFIIGFVSDKTRTRFGRRLPYIAIGSIFAPLAMWFLAAPPARWNLNELDALPLERHLTKSGADAVGDGMHALARSRGFLPFGEVPDAPDHDNRLPPPAARMACGCGVPLVSRPRAHVNLRARVRATRASAATVRR